MIFLVIGGLGKVTEFPGFRDPIKSLQFPLRRFGFETHTCMVDQQFSPLVVNGYVYL